MSIFKCKMCGGELQINPGESVAVCDYCGTTQTLPRLDDDRRANLYDRANHFRRNNDFDKAAGIYEQILNEDKTDAEAYWSLVLCRYGIEYVEDPTTHKRVPTVNRAQYTSVFDDEDYKSAIRYADAAQRAVYEAEAKAINEIQKGILEISQKEEPFDVFICYKESDANGRRTPDSVLATDLYHQLTQEGFKVFFSRITLEDKLGTAYEPYIFAALNSAKVMVVLGTKPEYFNAVWVKNEWSRYLALIRGGAKKVLIPAYRDMDPYDLPEEFSHLQAQDMSKLGFMQDLIRGIKKLTESDRPAVRETVVVQETSANTAPLLKRAFIFLEDGDWSSADEYCEKVLDIDPENAQAYLGKLMAEQHVRKQEELADQEQPFDNSDNFRKVIRFGDEKLEAEMRGYITHIHDHNENIRLTDIYNGAVNTMHEAINEEAYKEAASTFASIAGFKDADNLAKECIDKAEICRKDAIYSAAKSKITEDSVDSCEEAIRMFQSISGWKDADEQISACRNKIEEIKAETEKAAKKRKKALIIAAPIVCACIAFAIVFITVIIPKQNYNAVVEKLGQELADKLYTAEIGDAFTFGAYEQDNNESNGQEDVEWLVLAKEKTRILVISKYALDCKPYNTSRTDITWETCTLREWLNNDFINSAFSDDEKAMISVTTISADRNPEYNTNPGIATQDQVFLLSITEVKNYLSSGGVGQCGPTDYAAANGACKGKRDGNYWVWLRSPGIDPDFAASVSYKTYDSADVSPFYIGKPADTSGGGVRPAMWINLK